MQCLSRCTESDWFDTEGSSPSGCGEEGVPAPKKLVTAREGPPSRRINPKEDSPKDSRKAERVAKPISRPKPSTNAMRPIAAHNQGFLPRESAALNLLAIFFKIYLKNRGGGVFP